MHVVGKFPAQKKRVPGGDVASTTKIYRAGQIIMLYSIGNITLVLDRLVSSFSRSPGWKYLRDGAVLTVRLGGHFAKFYTNPCTTAYCKEDGCSLQFCAGFVEMRTWGRPDFDIQRQPAVLR